jgi:hypothetical protein
MARDDDNPLHALRPLIDLVIYVPLGAAALAREELPGLFGRLATRGREEAEQATTALSNQWAIVSTVGRAAFRQIARRGSERPGPGAKSPAESAAGPPPEAAADADRLDGVSAIRQAQTRAGRTYQSAGLVDTDRAHRPTAGAGNSQEATDEAPSEHPEKWSEHRAQVAEERREAELLAIPDYESLSAAQVNARLGALTSEELDAVQAYEESHRGRRTVLGRITALRS